MKILVTGGGGLVGSAIKEISSDYNYEFSFISSSECNLTNYEQTKKIFNNINPDYVIHLAAYVGGLYKSINNNVEMLENNLLINLNVIKCCHELKVKKLISCLSTCIFPDKISYPANEEMIHDGPPYKSHEGYAYAKRLLEIQSRLYNKQYNDNFICVIPTNIYGPNDNFSLENSHVIPSLIHRCYLSKQNKEKFVIRGTGKPLRQFIYSYDLANLLLWALEKYDKKENIILSVNERDEISIGDIADIISKSFNYENNIEYNSSYSDGQFKKTADNSKLLSLNNFKFTKIEIGIKQTVEWFIKNYNECRK